MVSVNIFQDPEGRYCLTVMDAGERTYALFDKLGLQGGGYTWQGITTALIEMQAPELLPRLSIFDAEADNMYAYCDDKTVLERIAGLIQAADKDHKLLKAAIKHAGDDLE